MTCHNCQTQCKKFGKDRHGLQRYRRRQCKRTLLEPHDRPLDEMRLPLEKALLCLQMLMEGMSVRATSRITGVHKTTLALHFAWYNFVRVHTSLRVTPAMEAGITGHVWELRELLSFGV